MRTSWTKLVWQPIKRNTTKTLILSINGWHIYCSEKHDSSRWTKIDTRFRLDFESQCYPSCLTLEKTQADTFLETEVSVTNNQIIISHYNKNKEHLQKTGLQRYYKQQNYLSYTPRRTKSGTLIGLWTRMQSNSSNDTVLNHALSDKLHELQHTLSYPTHFISQTLLYMHSKTKKQIWQQMAKNMVANMTTSI